MSLILEGIDLPKDCVECPLEENAVDGDGFDYWYCKITESTIGIADTNKRPSNCPLIQIPQNHGRLIDAKVFADTICQAIQSGDLIQKSIWEWIADAPTILEAEE